MWFERLDKGVEEANSTEAVKALYGIMYYYFTAICFIGLVWLLWQVMELRTAIAYNLALLAGVFGLMALVIDGLRRLKSWAKALLLINYLGMIGAAIVGLIFSFQALMVELTSTGVIAVVIYLLISLLCGYGANLLFSPEARKLNWG